MDNLENQNSADDGINSNDTVLNSESEFETVNAEESVPTETVNNEESVPAEAEAADKPEVSGEVPAETPPEAAPEAYVQTDAMENAPLPEFGKVIMEEKPAPKKRGKLLLAFLAGVLVFFAVSGVLALTQTPAKKLKSARSATMSDYNAFKANALFARSKDYIELTPQTELDFTIGLKNVSSKQGMPLFFLNNSSVSGSLNIDNEVKRLDVGLSLKLRDEDVVSAGVNLDETLLSLNVPELFGSKYYSVDLIELNGELGKQVIASLPQGVAGMIPADINASIAQLFTLTDKINELNKANTGENSAIVNVLEFSDSFIDITAKAEELSEVTKAEPAEVGGIKCDVYVTSYSEATVKELMYKAIEKFSENYEKNISTMKNVFPDLFSQLSGEPENPFNRLNETVDQLTLSKPLTVTYYVDKSKKIRRTVYEAAIVSGGETSEIKADITTAGEGNIFDAITATLGIKNGTDTVEILFESNGNHADKAVFTDASKITFTVAGDDGPGHFAVASNIRYDAALNETECEVSIESDDTQSVMTIGFISATETDKAAGTSKTIMENVYVESAVLDVTFSAEYGYAPAAAPPKTKGEIDYSEVLKLSGDETMAAYSEIYENYKTLEQKILSLFGY